MTRSFYNENNTFSNANLDNQLDYYRKLYAFSDEFQKKADDRSNANTLQQMGNANFFRTKEGGTPGQRDEQTFRRQDASLTNQRFMQQKGADLTDWQRNQDYNRASRAIGDMRNTQMTR